MRNTQRILLAVTLLASASVYAQGMADFDTDNNGLVSEQEFNDAKTKNIAARAMEGRQMRGLANAPEFSKLDVNHDGQLSKDEMQAMQNNHERKGQGKGQRQGKAQQGNEEQGKGMGRPPKPNFANFDANGDNSLTEQEYNSARDSRIGERAKEGRKMQGLANMASFADIDGNADGKISQEEFASFLAEHEKNDHH